MRLTASCRHKHISPIPAFLPRNFTEFHFAKARRFSQDQCTLLKRQSASLQRSLQLRPLESPKPPTQHPRSISPTLSARRTASPPDAPPQAIVSLLDLQPGNLRMAWTYENLTMEHFPLLAFKTPRTDWNVTLTPQIDGKPTAKSRWTRLDAGASRRRQPLRRPARLRPLGGRRWNDRRAGSCDASKLRFETAPIPPALRFR